MSKYTVLLIDYEPKSIDRVRRPLTEIGYRVEVATDGISGIEAFQRLQPDLVMVEAMIPKKHGFEVCQDLKKTPQGKRTPIIITTSVYKGRKYRNQAFHLHGCDEYIEKPIDEEQVVTICRRMLGDDSPLVASPMASTSGAADAGAADALELHSSPEFAESIHDFPPIPPAPAAMDDDEFEIMARLDAILPGAQRSTSPAPTPSPVTAPRPTPAAPAPPERDLFATSFLPTTEMMPNQDLDPRAQESQVATALEPVPLVPIGEPADPADLRRGDPEPESVADGSDEPQQVVPFESRKSKKKDRRNKKNGAAPSTPTPTHIPSAPPFEPAASDGPLLPVAAMSPADLEMDRGASMASESRASAASQIDPFDVELEDEPRRPWGSIGLALVLIAAAGAIIFLFLGH